MFYEEVILMEKDNFYMNLALEEAKKGRYQTWKNPMVGAVIVKNGQVLATGYHHHYGQNHAERDAISKLNPEQLFNSTLYVTLEPCNHYGKQPPCSDLIIKSGIKRVVVGQIDPHKLVTGKGIAQLQKNGIQVTTGVLADDASKLNKFYSYFYQYEFPWITVKEATSLDNKVAMRGQRTPITNQAVYQQVHSERADYQAIMIGSSTAIIDDPILRTNVKSDYPPIRIIIDRRGRLLNHLRLRLLSDTNPTWIFTQNKQMSKNNFTNSKIKIIHLATNKIQEVFDYLSTKEIQSVYVEGGPTLEKAIMNEIFVNEVIKYTAPIFLGDEGVTGLVPNETVPLTNVKKTAFGNNERIAGELKHV